MGSSCFISAAAVLDISRKATAVKEMADFIDRLHSSCLQNSRLSSSKLYCNGMLAVLWMPCDCGCSSGTSHNNVLLIEDNNVSP